MVKNNIIHTIQISYQMIIGTAVSQIELATLVHEHAVHQETSQSTVVKINTHTHDSHFR